MARIAKLPATQLALLWVLHLLIVSQPTLASPESAEASEGSGKCTAANAAAKETQVGRLIHAASALAALTDGGLAQMPGMGALVVPTIQAAMVYAVGHIYGCHLDRSHALSLVTYFSSGHVKQAFVKEVIGVIPFAGNVIKSSVTFFMTEGIGNMAHKMLSCGKAGLDEALKSSGIGQESGSEEQSRPLFHFLSDYLLNLDFGSISKEEAWQRVLQLLSLQDQGRLLETVRLANTTDELSQIMRKHVWNLEVVEAVLSTLQEKFPLVEDSCVAADFVASKLWMPEGVSAEARMGVSQYLIGCIGFTTPTTQAGIAHAASGLIAGSRGEPHGGIPPWLLRQSLELLEKAALETSIDMTALPGMLSASFGALLKGEASACSVVRTLLAREPRNRSAEVPPWASVRRLRQLDFLSEVPIGAELCFPALSADLRAQLQLEELPSGVELSSTTGAAKAKGSRGRSGGLGALGRLREEIVGQHCMLERLVGPVSLKYRGSWRQDMPLVLLFTGPSGTGKTLLARLLAEVLLGKPIVELERDGRFRTFHMNYFSLVEDQKSFFGPPKGISGKGDLPELLKEWPDAVVLLDEVEKAHPSFARALLKVFGENGAVYDPHTGRDVPTTGATFILTSNLGKEFISANGWKRAAPGEEVCKAYEQLHKDVSEALRQAHIDGRQNFFRESELRSRLTDVLPFVPFGEAELEVAVRGFLSAEAETLSKRSEFARVLLGWEPRVVSILASEYWRRPEEGLRGVQVQLQLRVREVLEGAATTGLLDSSVTAVLTAREKDGTGGLDLRVVPRQEVRTPPGVVTADAAGGGRPTTDASSGSGSGWGLDWAWAPTDPFDGQGARPSNGMKHLDSGFEPGELSVALVKENKASGYIKVNAPDPVCKVKVEQPWWFVPLEVFIFTSLWWTAAIVAIVQIKRTVSSGGIFPHPFALTSMVQMATGLLAYGLSQLVYVRRGPRPPLRRHEVLRLVLMGSIQGMEIGLTNKALEYLTVAGRTMISSSSVLIMMGTSWLWGLERLGWLRLASALFLISGGFVQGLDHSETGKPGLLLGVGLQVTSMILSSQRWALAQFVLQYSPKDSALGHMTKLQLLAGTLPITGLICVPLTIAFERDCCTFEEIANFDLAAHVFSVAVGLAAMLYAELKLVKRLSAVAFNVLATIHQVPIVLAGVLLRHDQVGQLSQFGFALCIVGALVYAAARQQDRKLAGSSG